MPSIAEQIEEKLSLSVTDWAVTEAEQREAVALLRSDVRVSATLSELNRRRSLSLLIRRVNASSLRRDLLDILAARADSTHADAIRRELSDLDVQVATGPGGAAGVTIAEQLWQVRFNLLRMGVPGAGLPFDDTRYRRLISSDLARPFTGQGATGIRPDSRSVPLGDQWDLLMEDRATTRRSSQAACRPTSRGSAPGSGHSKPS